MNETTDSKGRIRALFSYRAAVPTPNAPLPEVLAPRLLQLCRTSHVPRRRTQFLMREAEDLFFASFPLLLPMLLPVPLKLLRSAVDGGFLVRSADGERCQLRPPGVLRSLRLYLVAAGHAKE